jgi:hypothetical protein
MPRTRGQEWTDRDVSHMRLLVKRGVSMEGVARFLGRTVAACKAKAWKLGLRYGHTDRRRWTEAQEMFLLEHYGRGMNAPQIAARLGKSTNAVICRASLLEITGGRNWYEPA